VDNQQPVWKQIVYLCLIVLGFFKLLRYLKIFPNYGFLVQMIKISIIDVQEFILFFVMWGFFFTIQYKILDAEFEYDDYAEVNNFVQLAIIVFRTSIGDVQMAGYTKFTARAAAGEW
jgi:hypothetical protein